MDFIFVSLQRINTDRESTSTSIAKELSKSHRVLYVNPPIDRKSWLLGYDDPFVGEHIQNIKERKAALVPAFGSKGLSILSPSRIIESVNWIPNTKVFSFFNRFNNRKFAKCILEATVSLGLENYILVIDKDIFRSFYLKELLKPKHTVYLDRDYTLGSPYWKNHGRKLEPELISKCDAVVCNSPEFANNNKVYNKRSFYISNGANLGIFNSETIWEQPKELLHLERPLIGYVGALINSRLNIDLIMDVAKNLSTGTVVLIGPQDHSFLKSDLHKENNIQFIEKKNTAIIPSYISYFDVCINPQRLNKITMGNFPLKIVEYLSMGKPVVATATSTMKEVFNDYTYLATSAEDFLKQIYIALEEDDPLKKQNRIKFSKKHSWELVSQNLLNVIEILDQ